MLSKYNVKLNIVLITIITTIIPILISIFLANNTPIQIVNLPLHATLEVAGGVIAIVISMMFYIKFSKNYILTHFTYTTIALLTMGIIDIFHGIMMSGKLFVWLHSCAVFFGGLFFITIWLKEKKVSQKTYKLIPILSVLFAIVFSILSIWYKDFIPNMLNSDKSFSNEANLLNIIGGIGFFIASIKFLKEYIKTKDIEELLFAGHTMLFGVAGVLFLSSTIWDLQWWLWHFLRLFAYIIALYFLYIEFKKDMKILAHTNKELKKSNKKIKQYFNLIDKHVITSSTDTEGIITYASEAFCQISGYSKHELIGKKHSIVKHPDMPEEIYKKLWDSISNDLKWTGEIKNKKKNGKHYWVKATISPIYNNNGKKIGYSAIREDITDKKTIEEISITDSLTEIYNRRHFDEIFPKLINSTKRKNELLSFIILDIDYFKQYNDTYGHQMGDKTLIKVATTIKNSLNRIDDFCFRLGGEEFGILFKTTTTIKAFEFANTIRKNIEALQIKHENNSVSPYVTVSMGLICKNANEITNENEIYKQADELLYEAKANGRNQIVSL